MIDVYFSFHFLYNNFNKRGEDMSETEFIILIAVISFVIGTVLLLLSGLFIVKENECAVFEKLYQYKCHKEKGIYFFTPFFTKRVGVYKVDKQHLKVNIKNYSIYIIYQIEDVKKYHYSNIDFKEKVYENLKNNENDNYIDIINSLANDIGIKILGSKKEEN